MSRELAVLVWIVAAGLVATVVAIVALIRRGRTVPPIGDPWPEPPEPSKQRGGSDRPGARVPLHPALSAGTGRKA